jgi:hypothetical protein
MLSITVIPVTTPTVSTMEPVKFVTINVKLASTELVVLPVLPTLTDLTHQNVHVKTDGMMMVLLNVKNVLTNVPPVLMNTFVSLVPPEDYYHQIVTVKQVNMTTDLSVYHVALNVPPVPEVPVIVTVVLKEESKIPL